MGQCHGRNMAVGSKEQEAKKPNGWGRVSKAEIGRSLL